MEEDFLNNILEIEKEAFVEKLTFLNNQWKQVKLDKGHRTIFKDINNYNAVKETVKEKLGFLATFFFK